MVDLVNSDGGEPNGRGDLVAEYFGRSIAQVGINELSRDNAVPIEGLPVGEMGVRLPSVRGCVEPWQFTQCKSYIEPGWSTHTIRLGSRSPWLSPQAFWDLEMADR